MNEKARTLGKTLPHIWESREALMPNLVPDNEHDDALKASVYTALIMICDLISDVKASGENFSLGKSSLADGKEMIDMISAYLHG